MHTQETAYEFTETDLFGYAKLGQGSTNEKGLT